MLWDPLVVAQWVALQWVCFLLSGPGRIRSRKPCLETQGLQMVLGNTWGGGCDLDRDSAPASRAFDSISQVLKSGNSKVLCPWCKQTNEQQQQQKPHNIKIEILGWTSVWCYLDKSLNYDIEFNQFYWLAFKWIHSNSFEHRYSESLDIGAYISW